MRRCMRRGGPGGLAVNHAIATVVPVGGRTEPVDRDSPQCAAANEWATDTALASWSTEEFRMITPCIIFGWTFTGHVGIVIECH